MQSKWSSKLVFRSISEARYLRKVPELHDSTLNDDFAWIELQIAVLSAAVFHLDMQANTAQVVYLGDTVRTDGLFLLHTR